MSNIPKYDGTTDPQNHIIAYTARVSGNDLAPNVIKKFGKALTKGALTWNSHLSKNSINSLL